METLLKRGRCLRKVVTGQSNVGPDDKPKEYTTVLLRASQDGQFRIRDTMDIYRTIGEAEGLAQHWGIVIRLSEDGWVAQKEDSPPTTPTNGQKLND